MQVKDAILNAGVALLKERGIAALTQPQIARAAAVKQSHLTYYFPTRADLLLAIAEQSIGETVGAIGERLREQPQKATIAALGAIVADVVIAGIPPRLIIGLIVAADAEPGIRDALGGFISHVRGRLQEVLASAGWVADDDAALLFHATVAGLALMHQARLSAASEREVRSGVAAILRLLAPASAKATAQ